MQSEQTIRDIRRRELAAAEEALRGQRNLVATDRYWRQLRAAQERLRDAEMTDERA